MLIVKEECNNYLNSRVYNFIRAKKRRKAILRDTKKFYLFKKNLRYINNFINYLHKNIFLGIDVKENFTILHFVKILKEYVYINFYNKNIKKIKRNDRLLEYYKSLLNDNGFYERKIYLD